MTSGRVGPAREDVGRQGSRPVGSRCGGGGASDEVVVADDEDDDDDASDDL